MTEYEYELQQREREIRKLIDIAIEKWQETFGFGVLMGFLMGIVFSICMWFICN